MIKSNLYSKIVIWDLLNLSINSGGPSGFISQNLGSSEDSDEWIRMSEIIKKNNPSIYYKIAAKLLSYIIHSKSINKNKYSKYLFIKHEIFKYKGVFFHDVFSMATLQPLLKKSQIILLQSHSPELPSVEIKEEEGESSRFTLAKMIEKECFEKASYLVFPNIGCVEIYSSLITNASKVVFLMSACADFYQKYKKIPLENSKINLLYIGRQNHVKGFDILIDAYIKASEFRNDLRLFLIGKSTSVRLADLPKEIDIVEVGFSDKPQAWLESVDYVINANRSSYFDLSIMEALSCAKKIIMTVSQGHVFFTGISSDITEFSNKEELSEILSNLPTKDKNIENWSNVNRTIFESTFNSSLYKERLNDLLRSL